jgi:mannitol/fructose-specific phosphotransferase system IIA component (Ntr-type)
MKLASLLTPQQILLDMQSAGSWDAIVELVDRLDASGRLPAGAREDALAALRHRENLLSTGIGAGVAIPHAFLEHLQQVTAVFGRSHRGIAFGSADGAPVHFVVLFLIPCRNHALHMQTLAAIAKAFARKGLKEALANAASEPEIIAILEDRQPGAAQPGNAHSNKI